jgi:hypothetical protein
VCGGGGGLALGSRAAAVGLTLRRAPAGDTLTHTCCQSLLPQTCDPRELDIEHIVEQAGSGSEEEGGQEEQGEGGGTGPIIQMVSRVSSK